MCIRYTCTSQLLGEGSNLQCLSVQSRAGLPIPLPSKVWGRPRYLPLGSLSSLLYPIVDVSGVEPLCRDAPYNDLPSCPVFPGRHVAIGGTIGFYAIPLPSTTCSLRKQETVLVVRFDCKVRIDPGCTAS